MPHTDFLQLILSNEVARREAGSIALRAKNAGLDPAMRTETWDPTAISMQKISPGLSGSTRITSPSSLMPGGFTG